MYVINGFLLTSTLCMFLEESGKNMLISLSICQDLWPTKLGGSVAWKADVMINICNLQMVLQGPLTAILSEN
jgi:hypothetical protein